jgi:hypothetical protein
LSAFYDRHLTVIVGAAAARSTKLWTSFDEQKQCRRLLRHFPRKNTYEQFDKFGVLLGDVGIAELQ